MDNQSAEEMLKTIAEGGITQAVTEGKQEDPLIIDAPRMTNSYLRRFVAKLKEKGMSNEDIIHTVLDFDAKVQNGSLTKDIILHSKQDGTKS